MESCGILDGMDAPEHGERMRDAMAEAGLSIQDVADGVGVTYRTVSSWLSGAHMPPDIRRGRLRKLLGDYTNVAPTSGDAVVDAVHLSALTEDRQYEVIGFYKRKLREQEAEQPRRLSVAPDTTSHLAAADEQGQTASGESESYHET